MGVGIWLKCSCIKTLRVSADRLRWQTPSISTSQQAPPLASVPTRNSERESMNETPAGPWRLDLTLTLSTQLNLERSRRSIPRVHRHELEALADSLLVAHVHQQQIIRQALGRVAELEAREAIRDPAPRHHQWAREVLGLLRG